eukprot:2461482-Rhodomonas_salina.3
MPLHRSHRVLRRRYVLSGTHLAYVATRRRCSSSALRSRELPVGLRPSYAMCGTDLANMCYQSGQRLAVAFADGRGAVLAVGGG